MGAPMCHHFCRHTRAKKRGAAPARRRHSVDGSGTIFCASITFGACLKIAASKIWEQRVGRKDALMAGQAGGWLGVSERFRGRGGGMPVPVTACERRLSYLYM